MEDSIILSRAEAWDVERAVDAAEKSGLDDPEAASAFHTVAVKLLPDLFPDQ